MDDPKPFLAYVTGSTGYTKEYTNKIVKLFPYKNPTHCQYYINAPILDSNRLLWEGEFIPVTQLNKLSILLFTDEQSLDGAEGDKSNDINNPKSAQ